MPRLAIPDVSLDRSLPGVMNNAVSGQEPVAKDISFAGLAKDLGRDPTRWEWNNHFESNMAQIRQGTIAALPANAPAAPLKSKPVSPSLSALPAAQSWRGNNDKGLQAKADLAERARAAAAQKTQEAASQAAEAGGISGQQDARDIRAGMAAQAANVASTVPVLKGAADDFAARAVQAYNSGDKVQGDKYLGYASSYYKAAGEAQEPANNLTAAAPKFQLPPAAVGKPGADLKFELELGAAAYAIVGGNVELKLEISISRPFESRVTEFEAGLGVGLGFKAKTGLNSLQGAEHAVAGPLKPLFSDGGQANGTGAVSTTLEIEGSIPLLTLTAFEARGGVQSPLNGIPAKHNNFGGFYQYKILEPKVSPFLNIGASAKWDLFNTSYKRSSPNGQ